MWDARHAEWAKKPNLSTFEQKSDWFEIRYSHLLPRPEIPSDGWVIDFGCGCGLYSVPLRRRFSHYVGVDTSLAALQLAETYFAHTPDTVFLALEPNTVDLPLPDARFDCAITITCLQHLPIPRRLAAIQEIKRVLKPGGKYIGLEMMGNPQAADMPPMSEIDWLEAWKPMKLVMDLSPDHPEWANDNIWRSL